MTNKFPLIFIAAILLAGLFYYQRNSSTFFKGQSSDGSSQQSIVAIGNNNNGQLGISPNDEPSGSHAISDINDVVEIAAGRNFSGALTEEGDVYLWGGNDWGQLGFVTNLIRQDTPHKNEDLNDVSRIALSNNHAVILKKDGSVWTFGSNFSGQLGTGDNKDSKEPVQVKNISEVSNVAAGYKFSTALKKDGTVWAWGASCDPGQKKVSEEWWKNIQEEEEEDEEEGEGGYYDPNSDALATNDKNEYCINEDIVGILSKTPVQVKNLTNITQLSAGYGHVLALGKNGDVFSFGCNTYKQLGRIIKEKSETAIPAKIAELSHIKKVTAGYRHSFALAEDGTLWGWGDNDHGQLGDGTDEIHITPVKLPVSDVKEIVAGYDHTFIIKNDGTVWGWGRNTSQWFGDTTVEYVNTPTQIKDLKNMTKLAVGGAHLLVLEEKN